MVKFCVKSLVFTSQLFVKKKESKEKKKVSFGSEHKCVASFLRSGGGGGGGHTHTDARTGPCSAGERRCFQFQGVVVVGGGAPAEVVVAASPAEVSLGRCYRSPCPRFITRRYWCR